MISSDFTKCMANLGHTYKAIVGEYQSNEARNYLAGAFNFDLKELEVYIFEIWLIFYEKNYNLLTKYKWDLDFNNL